MTAASIVVTRAAFIERVLSYCGTPYVEHGRVPGPRGGMDCPAPALVAARELGLVAADFDITGYGRVPDGRSLRAWCERYMTAITWEDALPGDVLLCSYRHGPEQHLGVLVERGADRQYWVQAEGMIHQQVRRCRVAFGDRFMQLRGVFRIPGLVDGGQEQEPGVSA